jgi:hypothetical protein
MQFSDAAGARRPVSYDVWCECVSLLLGRNEVADVDWPVLYSAGMTPLQAARETGFREPAADARVWV